MTSVAALALSIILVTAFLSYEALRAKTIDVAEQSLRSQANTLRNDLEGRISHLTASLKDLSANALFANALADDLGHEVYMREFLSGFTTAEGFDLSIFMTDFQGNTIRTNRANAELHADPGWAASAIESTSGKGIVTVHQNSTYLIIAEPIIFYNTGTAEGALLYQVNLADWLHSHVVQRLFKETPWLSTLSLVDANTHQHITDTTVHVGGDSTITTPEFHQNLTLPDFFSGSPLAIHLSAKDSFIQQPLNELLVNVSMMSALIFAMALLGSFFLSRTLTRKLSRLRREAAQVSETKEREVEFTNDEQDEIDDLALAFSVLIDELQDAYRQLEDESKREIELRERHYQGIVQNSAEGIITISKQGTVETFNPSAERIFGYGADEVIGKNVSMLMPEQEREAHSRYLEHSKLRTPKILSRTRDLTGRRKEGETFPLELNISPMEVGAETKFIGIMRDISERKEFENRINAARVEAEHANKAKSQFLSSMSHELRTPLNAILGFGQLLEMDSERTLSKSQCDAVRQILKGGRHLLDLIDQVLNLAKIENGNMTISIEPLDIVALLNDTLAMAQTMAKDKEIKVIADIPPLMETLYVNADRTRLQQVLLNLLSNAIKYNTPKGSVFLSYTLPEDRAMCRVTVTDNGPGIPEHLHGDVFQPFNRLGAEGSDVEGTGIGLSITRELVRMMKGEIGFTSKPGQGSKFWFDIPITDNAARPDIQAAAISDIAESVSTADDGKRTVLYIEDNQSNLQLMEMVFDQRENLELISTPTAENGLAIARATPPDLILMDINLPGMNGIEALHALRNHPSTAHIPAIAISANAMPREIDEAMRAGFLEYLTKPLDLKAALEAIEKALSDAP